MADEVQDIRIRLTAEDRASDPTRRLLREISALEKKLNSGFGKSKIIGSIVDDASLKLMSKAGKAVDGLTQKTMLWARGQREMGKVTHDAYHSMERAIKRNLETFEKASKKKQQLMRKDLVDQIKKAQAFRHLLNQDHRERVRMEEKLHEKLARIGDAQHRRMERAEATHQRNIIRHRRSMMRSLASAPGRMMNRLDGNGFFNSPAFYAMAAGAGTVAAGRSFVRSATDLDKAETFARMHMDQSKVNARDLRNNFVIPRSIELGQDPARLFTTIVDASKAGVPDAAASATAEMVTQVAKVFGVEVEQAMDGMGFAIAQEIGSGRLKGDDISGIRRIGNITAFLAGKTAARPDQMLSFLRTGLGSGAMLGMDQQSTLAFGAAAIQAGAQGQQAARMLGSMAEDINNLTTRAKDVRRKHTRSEEDKMFLRLPGLLGYGSFEGLHDSFKKSPNTAIFDLLKSFGKIKDFDLRNRAMTAMFGADFARFMSNLISSPGILDSSQSLAKEAGAQKAENDWLATSWIEFQKSLEYFLGKVKATWTVLKSELGDVMKPFLDQFSQWVGDWYKAVRTGGLKERFKAILDGLTTGFLGKPGTFRDLLDSMFGKPGEGDAGNPEKYLKFAKGFAEGLKSVVSMIGGAMKGIAKSFGVDTADPEAMGKFIAQFLGVVTALHFLRPVISVMGLFADGLFIIAGVLNIVAGLGIFNWLSKIPGAKGLAGKLLGGAVLGGAGAVGGMALLGDGRGNNNPSDFKGLVEEYKKAKEEAEKKKKQEGATDFSGARKQNMSLNSSVDDLTRQMEKFGGKVERASFMTGTLNAFRSGSSRGGGLSSPSVSSPAIGGVPEIFNSTPGGTLPNMGGPSGPMIKRGSFSGGMNRGAFDRMFAGTPLAGKYDAIVSAAKANGIDPALLAGIIAHESGRGKFLSGNNPGGIMDPSTGWARKMQFGSLDDGINKTASTVAKNYRRANGSMQSLADIYAPRGAANDPGGLNKNWLGGVSRFRNELAGDATQGLADKLGLRGGANFMHGQFGGPGQNLTTITTASGKKLTVNSAAAESFKGFVDDLEASGYHIKSLGGFSMRQKRGGSGWSQHAFGNAIDINPATNPMTGKLITDMPPNVRDMAAKWGLSWGGDWKSKKDAMHFEWMGKKPWLDPSNLTGQVPSPTQNVPPPSAVQSGQTRAQLSGGGPVAIHINGNSHDPEALATLVQRRIDEAMNWRMHDIDHTLA